MQSILFRIITLIVAGQRRMISSTVMRGSIDAGFIENAFLGKRIKTECDA